MAEAGARGWRLRPAGRLWHHPDFLKFWAGQSLSRLGTFVTGLALPTAAIQLLGAGPVEVGALAALQSLPFPLLGIPSGVLADRLPRRPVMIVCDLGRLVALGSVPLAFLGPGLSIYHLYVVALLVGVFTPFAVVASQAYLKALVDNDDLMEANARLEVSNSTAGVAGRALAGLLIYAIQAPLAILVDAASYLVSATLLLAVRKPEPVLTTPRGAGVTGSGFWQQAAHGLAATFGDRTIRLIAASSATVNLGQSIAQAVYLLYAYQALGLNAAEVGFVLTIGSVGSVLGSLAVYPVSRRIGAGPAMAAAVVVAFASYLLLPLAQAGLAVPLLGMAAFVMNVCLPIYFVNTVTVRQATVPNHLQGRVVGTIRTVVIATTPIGAALGGLLGQYLGLVPALLIGGTVGMLAVAWVLAGPVRIGATRRLGTAS
jgi:MFS family permease